MKPTQTLPPEYTLREKININSMLSPTVQIIGIGLAVAFGFFFLLCYTWMHPAANEPVTLFEISSLGEVGIILISVVGLTALMIVLHEGIHGFFFWFFTRQRPKFAFKGFYAYAAMPQWYIPRNQYLWVGVAPLLILSLAGLGVMAVAPGWFLGLWFLLTSNAGGAIGDLFVCQRLLRYPALTLIHDQGSDTEIYGPEN